MNRRAVLLSPLALAVGVKVAEARPPFAMARRAEAVPALAFTDVTGRSLSLGDFAGRVVLLNIWATWCPPCRSEMPALERLQRRLAGADFAVVPLSIDAEGPAAARRFYSGLGIRNLAVYWGEALRVQLALAAYGLPTTLLINRNGQEVARLSGPAEWDQPAAIAQIEGVLNAG